MDVRCQCAVDACDAAISAVKHFSDHTSRNAVCTSVTIDAQRGLFAALDELERNIGEAGLNGIVMPLETIEHGAMESIEAKTEELHQETMKVNRNAGAILREFERLEQIRVANQQQEERERVGVDGGASGMSVHGGGGGSGASVVTESAYTHLV